MRIAELPADINVGDKVRFLFTSEALLIDSCSHYQRYLHEYDDWYYITRITYEISDGAEVNELVLEKYLNIDRETRID